MRVELEIESDHTYLPVILSSKDELENRRVGHPRQ
jgi:hypothetical protein